MDLNTRGTRLRSGRSRSDPENPGVGQHIAIVGDDRRGRGSISRRSDERGARDFVPNRGTHERLLTIVRTQIELGSAVAQRPDTGRGQQITWRQRSELIAERAVDVGR